MPNGDPLHYPLPFPAWKILTGRENIYAVKNVPSQPNPLWLDLAYILSGVVERTVIGNHRGFVLDGLPPKDDLRTVDNRFRRGNDHCCIVEAGVFPFPLALVSHGAKQLVMGWLNR